MYHISDKKGAIREVQKYLLAISQRADYLPHVTVDGFYGEETRLAVSDFQREYSLPITGTVNRETFDLLFEQYIYVTDTMEHEKNIFNIGDFPLKRGSGGNDVSVLNSMIRELAFYYRDLESPYGDYYSSVTEEAIKLLQGYFIEEKTGIVTVAMFDRLKEEIKARKNFPQAK